METETETTQREWKAGDRARFFHPHTFGTMEYGTLLEEHGDYPGTWLVRFERDLTGHHRPYWVDVTHWLP